MATYVISDIHGEYEMYLKMLEKIHFSENDLLYVIGDCLDRGPNPISIILHMMEHDNIIPMAGNHEAMAMNCLEYFVDEMTDEEVASLDEYTIALLINWEENGSVTTIDEFYELDREQKLAVIDYINDSSLYEKLTVNGQKYLLVHAGLGNFSPYKNLDDYTLNELVWERPDYEVDYFDDTIVITGHTPTALIEDNPNPSYIYRSHNHIDIDCGACFYGGRLGCLCLDTNEEFYVERNDNK